MSSIFNALKDGLCWALSVPPEAVIKVMNVVKAVVCGTPE